MSSGLIWAGLGQGIANAGQSVGNAMMKKISDEEAMSRLEKQAELADQRAEAKEIRKEQRAEAQAKLDGENYSAALKAAEDMPAKRDAGLLSRASGMELSPEEMETVKNMSPEARKAYEESGMLKPRGDQRLEFADDAIQAAGSKGASSNVMKSLQDMKAKTLELIKSENNVRATEIKTEGAAANLERRLDHQAEQGKLDREAAERRTNRVIASRDKPDPAPKLHPIDSKKLDSLEEAARRASRELDDIESKPVAGDRGKLALTKAKEKAEAARKAADDFRDSIDDRKSAKQPSGKPASGTQSSGPVKVTDKSAYDALPPGTRYQAPDGSIRTKK